MANVPIKREVLIWARNFRALSVTQAASKLRIPESELQAIENGDQQVSMSLFRKIQKKYKLSAATLALPTPPQTPRDPKDFRTFAGPRMPLTYDTKLAISTARERLYSLSEIILKAPELPLGIMTKAAADLAKSERNRLGVTDDLQLGLRNPSSLLRELRTRIEGEGIYVYAEKYPTSECRGFCLIENDLAAIVLSKDELTHGARVFTLAHEYCHVLIRRPGISDQQNSNNVERYCNQFAAEFLMPKSLLDRIVLRDELNIENVRLWSNSIGVSQQSFALRLEELGIARKGFYDYVIANQSKTPKKKSTKPVRIKKVISTNFQLGFRMTNDVFNALHQKRINQVDASRILNLAPKYFTACARANPLARSWMGAGGTPL
jgi:Zn-dependent peptidase ImmA (M78 family)